MKLQANSDRAQTITKAIGVFMALVMWPFCVVENDGFTHLLSVLEPRYQLPSRPHFSQNVLPHLYSEGRAKLVEDLSDAKCIALTTDGWTSRVTQSFMTITAHYITDNWVIKNPVLQTRAVYECHASDHLSEILQGAVAEWKIDRENATIPVTTREKCFILTSLHWRYLFHFCLLRYADCTKNVKPKLIKKKLSQVIVVVIIELSEYIVP